MVMNKTNIVNSVYVIVVQAGVEPALPSFLSFEVFRFGPNLRNMR